MLTLLHHTTDVHQCQFSLLEALLEEPFPRTPEDLLTNGVSPLHTNQWC